MDLTWGEQYLPESPLTFEWLWSNRKEILRIIKNHRRRQTYNEEAYRTLIKHGIIDSSRPGNPACDPGRAIELAEERGIILSRGTSYSSIKAIDPEWKGVQVAFDIHWNWMDRQDMCKAICDVIFARLEDESSSSRMILD